MAPIPVTEDRLTSGHRLSHPPPGEEVLITGVSGYFPDSDSVMHLQENLFNKRTGKINNVDKFDASFFGVHYKQAHTMDPMCRILLEKAYEAVIDAGVNPKELRNTKTGVFVGACFSESEKTWFYEKMQVNGFGVTGSIRDGHCDAAIVGGSNLCLHPYVSLQFSRLGVLSLDGKCKSFDNSANGYARSEAIVVCFLQKAKDSRRVYAQLLHAKTNCDGYKEQGITYPAGNIQKLLLSEFYEECSIVPSELEFVEAHGTGTKVGDPEELKAIDEIFCTGRSEPLKIGSIKSNLGHSEPASGLCSIAKLCIAYTTGYIPPNLHYNTPREGVPSLNEGRLQVVSTKTPWNRGMAGINSFGFGGANAHVLLKNVARPKINNGIPNDDLPRLVCVSGRTESAVAKILDDVESRTVDIELVKLLHTIHNDDIAGHVVRGYTLLGSTPTKAVSLSRSVQYFSGVRRPVWFVYSGMGSQWAGMATELMRIPVFAAAIDKCHKALEPKGINLTKIITEPEPRIYDNILNSFIGIAAVQIGLTDVLKAVGIEPDYIIDGCFTAEQMILAAYSRGLASVETPFIKGSMAAIKSVCPPEVEVACHNGPDSCTISGPAAIMKIFVERLVEKGVFAKEVPCSNIAYHSRYIAEAGPTLLKYLKEVIPSPKPRSEKWVSTSVPQALWKDPKASLSSAEYHTNNLLSPVLFEETSRLIPQNAVTIEIAPHGLLQAILRRSLKKDVVNIALTKKGENNVDILLAALGKLYEVGMNPQLANIYPHVPFPVSLETPMLSHLVEWEHSEDWFVSISEPQTNRVADPPMFFDLTIVYIIIYPWQLGRNLYPATGYLVLVWETLGMMMGELYTEVSVVFENVRFQRATNVPKEGNLEFINIGKEYRVLKPAPEATGPNVKHLLTKDFYKELRLRGYQYSGLFRGVLGSNIEGTRGRVAWVNNWVTFMDCMLQMKIVGNDTRGLFVPTRIEKLSIDANMHYDAISKMNPDSNRQSFEIRVYPDVDVIRAGGVECRGLHATPISKKIPLGIPVLEKNEFIPNFGDKKMKVEDILRANIQLILENVQTYKVKSIELVDEEYKLNNYEPIITKVSDVLEDLPLVQPELLLFSEEAIEMPADITVENKKLSAESNVILFIGANLFKRPEILQQAVSTLREKCFIISREKDRPNPKDYSDKFDIITIQDTGAEYLVLFRKRVGAKPAKFVKVVTHDPTFAWIDKLKEELKAGQKVVVYNSDEPLNGLLGLVNCLRREPGGEIVSGLLIADPSAPAFNPDLEFYEEQLDKDLAINVYQEGKWGTYRHLLLGDLDTVRANHAFVNTVTIGDLSSLRWLEGPIKADTVFKTPTSVLVHVSKSLDGLQNSHIGNSRDTSFEDMIRRETNGKGVDLVLNSLSDEKLQASVRCLGYRGRFLEIGKFDISNNTPIGMYFFLKETSFHGIMLDYIFDQGVEFRKLLHNLLLTGIQTGGVRPLTYTTFHKDEVETAFRYMASGKHIGKVIIKIREEERSSTRPVTPGPLPFDAVPRYMCTSSKVYIVVGGLGGFGLELADWLILRGARQVLLTSRRGITNGYQSSRLRAWAGYGANVQISTDDITTEEGCEKMLKMANDMGTVEAIFNLAVILKDSIFQNQTPETFRTSFAPKAIATMNLDKLSRKLCPNLNDFVIFSSVSCGRGNAGQTNYGMSNSVMERICEWRKKLGLPAMAVQWGAVGDVGLVADMQDEDVQLEIGGTLQQRISSCLLALDKFLKQDAVIVSSIVVAEKRAGGTGCGNIVDAVAQIMGIKDMKTVSHQVSLAELGMDSMMAIEIKQTLEREFEVFLTAQDIRTLTFAKLVELTAEREAAASTSASAQPVVAEGAVGLRVLMRNFGDEKIANEPFVYVPTMVSDGNENEITINEDEKVMFVLPGIEGCSSAMEQLCKRLKIKICVLQLGCSKEEENLEQLVTRLYTTIKSRLVPGAPFILLGHEGIVFCVDGAPDFLYALLSLTLKFQNEKDLQNKLLCHAIDIVAPNNTVTGSLAAKLNEIESYHDRVQHALSVCPVQTNYSNDFTGAMAISCYYRIKMVVNMKAEDKKKIKSPVVLLRPKENFGLVALEDNYGLDKMTDGGVTVHFLEGNHVTIVENKDCANIINRTLIQGVQEGKPAGVVTSIVENQRTVKA
ncbi:unnamed protein product [Leptidea sinapis]|uniref:Fatty acid synthase n=1 Tax=Leptidea sinapis TaxID=189913 RepID=A0A5E4PUI7_9NEOP|nr:unnamed protein product [Leptidea sinapis]